jgi:Mce-associated membrane protein
VRGEGSGDRDGSARPASPDRGPAGPVDDHRDIGRDLDRGLGRDLDHNDRNGDHGSTGNGARDGGDEDDSDDLDAYDDRDARDLDHVDDEFGDEFGDDFDVDDDYDDDLDDDVAGGAADGGFAVRPFWARTSTLVVVVVLLFMVSGAVTAWLRISDLQERLDTLESQTLAAEGARQAAIVLAQDLGTYDYRDLGGNFRRVAAGATPRFADQLRRLTAELGPELQQTRAVATATARSAGVVSADLDKAVIAVFVDQTVTNTKTPEPRIEHSRMELTLLRQGDVWRLDQAGEL